MITPLMASMLGSVSNSSAAALRVCRPAIARKAEGQIANISVERSSLSGRTNNISGQVTIFVGMGPPSPGSASAHHLIRAEYVYSCSVRAGHVRALKLSQ